MFGTSAVCLQNGEWYVDLWFWSLPFSIATIPVSSELLLTVLFLNEGRPGHDTVAPGITIALYSSLYGAWIWSTSTIFTDDKNPGTFPVSLLQFCLLHLLNTGFTPSTNNLKRTFFPYPWEWIDRGSECIHLSPWEADIKTRWDMQESCWRRGQEKRTKCSVFSRWLRSDTAERREGRKKDSNQKRLGMQHHLNSLARPLEGLRPKSSIRDILHLMGMDLPWYQGCAQALAGSSHQEV